LPAALIVSSAVMPPLAARPVPIWVIVSPSIRTSAAYEPSAVTIVPLLMSVRSGTVLRVAAPGLRAGAVWSDAHRTEAASGATERAPVPGQEERPRPPRERPSRPARLTPSSVANVVTKSPSRTTGSRPWLGGGPTASGKAVLWAAPRLRGAARWWPGRWRRGPPRAGGASRGSSRRHHRAAGWRAAPAW